MNYDSKRPCLAENTIKDRHMSLYKDGKFYTWNVLNGKLLYRNEFKEAWI